MRVRGHCAGLSMSERPSATHREECRNSLSHRESSSHPKGQPTAFARSRVGRTSQPFTMVALTSFVRAGAGTSPDRRLHALGSRNGSLHIARSWEKTRCPRLFSPSNKDLATVPARRDSRQGMVDCLPDAPISFSTRKDGLSNGYGPCS